MYPSQLLSLFPAFPRDDRVFVAMSFDPRFDGRWKNVLEPAIRSTSLIGRPLVPFRVDARRVSDSILTEIVTAIANARLILADVTTIHILDGRVARNANVFYEVGLAHAVRLPEEVLLFRSDRDEMAFDIANVRVNPYDPDGKPVEAKRLVSDTISDALRELDLRRSLTVQRTVDRLDGEALEVLVMAARGQVKQPVIRTLGDFRQSALRVPVLHRLIEMGLLRPTMPPYSTYPPDQRATALTNVKQKMAYVLTDFGQVVIQEAKTRLGL